jgi:hypothetical protein
MLSSATFGSKNVSRTAFHPGVLTMTTTRTTATTMLLTRAVSTERVVARRRRARRFSSRSLGCHVGAATVPLT